MLQTVGGGVACLLGQLPAVLSGYRGEQPAHVITHTAAKFHTAEAMTDAHEEVVQLKVPLLGSTLDDHAGRIPHPLSLPAALSHDRGAASVKPPLTTPQPATLQPPGETRRSDCEILLAES